MPLSKIYTGPNKKTSESKSKIKKWLKCPGADFVLFLGLLILCLQFHHYSYAKNDKPKILKDPTAVVVHVQNDLVSLKTCLNSLEQHAMDDLDPSAYDYNILLVIVIDNSDEKVTNFIRAYQRARPPFHEVMLLELTPGNGLGAYGYTKGVNLGLKAALNSQFPWTSVVVLNSDTIVTKGWIQGLIQARTSKITNYGMVGPLTNTGSYQSVFESNPAVLTNLNHNWTPHHMSNVLHWIEKFPTFDGLVAETRFLNAFCMMIGREVFSTIGLFDDELFPNRYGFEKDFQLRLNKAGFSIGIATNVYVHNLDTHLKNEIYEISADKALEENWLSTLEDVKLEPTPKELLPSVRKEINLASQFPAVVFEDVKVTPRRNDKLDSFLFLLPKKPNPLAGGIISIIDVALGMIEKGIIVQLAITPRSSLPLYIDVHPHAHQLNLFWAYDFEDKTKQLSDRAEKFQFIVSTFYLTVFWVKEILETNSNIRPVYFIQDYEPWFFPEDTQEHKDSLASYDHIPNQVGFVKTNWLRGKVESNHHIPVLKMQPGIDFDYFSQQFSKAPKNFDGKIHISSMVRPRTPRRSALLTLKVLNALYNRYPNQVVIHIFGYRPGNIEHFNMSHLIRPEFKTHGLLHREEVAEILARSDIFMDLSVWQAFGRTGLEAMAAHCVPVMPKLGGAGEYCTHEKDCLLVQTTKYPGEEDVIPSVVASMGKLLDDPGYLGKLQDRALEKSRKFTLKTQTETVVKVFQDYLDSGN